jgi:FKBP-type peptidyl-prolyl cis-trans isomerase
MREQNWFRRLCGVFLILLGLGCTRQDPAENLKAGEAFLAENAKKEGVIVTASGLQYKVLQAGSGQRPAADDNVTVNYRGELINGSEFDNGEGISFPLNGVIAGWTEGLQLMQEGGKNRFFIPAALAYGETGAGRVIPPNAALVFDVELVKVNR